MTTEAHSNALDTGLAKLYLASHYLEILQPSKTDVKKASEAAKDAADILKSCLVLLAHDCYSIQDPPQGAPTPLFHPDGQPQAAAAVEIAGSGRAFKVGDRVIAISTGDLGAVVEDDGDPEDKAPFKVEFEGGSEMRMSADELELVEAERMPRDVPR